MDVEEKSPQRLKWVLALVLTGVLQQFGAELVLFLKPYIPSDFNAFAASIAAIFSAIPLALIVVAALAIWLLPDFNEHPSLAHNIAPATRKSKVARFIDVTPEQLIRLCRGMTELQGEEVLKPYVGCTIETDGIVTSIHGGSGPAAGIRRKSGASILCIFPDDQKAQLLHVNEGDLMLIRGDIARVAPIETLVLTDCHALQVIPSGGR